MTAPTCVDVSAFGEGFAPSLVEELRASIDSTGDCAVCLHELGSGTIIVEARPIPGGMPNIVAACARHAACGPITQRVGIDFSPDPTWRGLVRIVSVDDEPMVIVTLNPSIDHHIVRRWSGDTHLTDIWHHFGFSRPGQQQATVAPVGSVRVFPFESSIQITTTFGSYGFGIDGPLVPQALRDRSGLLLTVLFDRDAMVLDVETTREFVSCDYSAHGWIQLEG